MQPPSENASRLLPAQLAQSRGWLVFFGVFSVVVGIIAILFPKIVSIAVEQLIGIVCVVTGVFSITAVLFGKEKTHRVSSVFLALIRLVTGVVLLMWVESGVAAITVIVAAFFVAEGVVFLVAAMRYPGAGRTLMALNGVVALILGGMIFAQFPNNEAWVIGLLYGINAFFYGVSLLALAGMAPDPSKRAA